MIITGIINLFLSVFSILFNFTIPSLPFEVLSYFETLFDWLSVGASIFVNYAPMGYLAILWAVVFAIDLYIMAYHLGMWILKKIPIANFK